MAGSSLLALLPDRQLSEAQVREDRDYYIGLPGFVLPPIKRALICSRADPELLAMQEQLRCHCMYPKAFDVKTTPLVLFGMLRMGSQDTVKLPAMAALNGTCAHGHSCRTRWA